MNKLALVALMIFACGKPPDVPPPPPPADTQPPAQEEQAGPRVTFPDGFVVRVEIAADDELRARGLMFRDQLRPGTGMLFFFPRDGDYPFWMKNTLIPLDMIWIDRDKKIAAIQHQAQPCRVEQCPNYPPSAIARYVLEVAGGVAKEHGLKVGDPLKFEGTDHVVAQ